MMTLSRTYAIEVAHSLPDHDGVHGHSYEVTIEISANADHDYVLPLSAFESLIKPVITTLDHTYLNTIIPVPTMENMARWLWERLADQLPLSAIIITRPTLKMSCRYTGPDHK